MRRWADLRVVSHSVATRKWFYSVPSLNKSAATCDKGIFGTLLGALNHASSLKLIFHVLFSKI